MHVGRTFMLPVLLFLTAVPAWAKTDTVRVADFQFTPKTLTIHTGGTVLWKVEGRCCDYHTVTSGGSEPFGSDLLDVGQTFQYTFNQTGTHPYFCQSHVGEPPYGFNMSGTILVVDPPSIPTLQFLGLFLLLGSLAVAAIWVLKRKNRTA